MRAKAPRVLKDPFIHSSRDASPYSYFTPALIHPFMFKNHANICNINIINLLEVNY